MEIWKTTLSVWIFCYESDVFEICRLNQAFVHENRRLPFSKELIPKSVLIKLIPFKDSKEKMVILREKIQGLLQAKGQRG